MDRNERLGRRMEEVRAELRELVPSLGVRAALHLPDARHIVEGVAAQRHHMIDAPYRDPPMGPR